MSSKSARSPSSPVYGHATRVGLWKRINKREETVVFFFCCLLKMSDTEEKREEYMRTTVHPLLTPAWRDNFMTWTAALGVSLRGGNLEGAWRTLETLTAGSAEVSFESTARRAMFVYHVGPATPTPRAVAEIVRFLQPGSRVLEANAHRGVWSRLVALQRGGGPHVAVHRDAVAYAQTLVDVWRVESPESFVQGAGDRFDMLLLVAPAIQPTGDADAAACVRAFGGRFVVHVRRDNEDEDATTAAIDERFKSVGGCPVPSWGIARDYLAVYERREQPFVAVRSAK